MKGFIVRQLHNLGNRVRIKNDIGLWVIASLLFALPSCTSKTIELNSPPISEYFIAQPGKYILYKVDSTVPTRFGADTTVRSYQAKDEVDAEVMDALGRKAYRVFRYMRNATGTDAFLPAHTFLAVPQQTDWLEWIENNLRFMKLRFPIQEGFSWKGNSFIDVSSINSPVRYLADWEYTYQNVGAPFTINGKTYPNTITILQRDEVLPEGPFNPSFFKQWDYSIEVYAAGVGLIYKNFDHKIWQPPLPPPDARPGYWEDGSYRIVLSALDHN
jgi:hypothetical protein